MHDLIAHLKAGDPLSAEQIDRAVAHLTASEWEDEVKAELLRAFREKGETAEEIAAFARALLARAVDPGLDASQLPGPVIDVCGTGGDRMELFNVSTTSMFILAAAGAVVVKHGNRAITSKCGGADVLEQLGVRIDLPPEQLRRCVAEVGLGFIFAPAYHPAFKAIAPVRKLLAAQGVPTVFNLLGPLLNPARPPHQLVGIFDRALLPKYAATLQALGRSRAWAVHGDGTDELATTGPSEVHEVTPSGIRSFTLAASDFGIAQARIEDLRGGDCAGNAAILTGILEGSLRGPKREMVVFNAAGGLVVASLARDLPAGLALAREQLDSGRALAKLHALRHWSSPR
ncbi:MAG: anthranilate phosphoribosyltransferase [Chthoniobacter sp.]|jgi:anthranilate phosphoribosyltransferase|nr:anthranilate phosphoribosyltransferase [Chthoniobacter sp.]